MIVSRGKLIDGYTEWQMNTTQPCKLSLFYGEESGVSEHDSDEIEELRDQIEALHELIDNILLDK